MSTVNDNDRNILTDYANELSTDLFGTSLNFNPDTWDKSGAVPAVTESLGKAVKDMLTSWENVAAYRERRYQLAEKAVTSAQNKIGGLTNPASAEAAAIRRAAEAAAQGMRDMGDRAASNVPTGASTDAKTAAAAKYVESFAKAAGAAMAIGQMAAKT